MTMFVGNDVAIQVEGVICHLYEIVECNTTYLESNGSIISRLISKGYAVNGTSDQNTE